MQNLEPPASLAFHPAAGVVSFGPFQFDRAERLLRRDGAEIALPPRAVGVLEHLLERTGRVVSKQALIDAVWPDAYVTETSLAEAVSLLRQALGDDPQNPRFIQTLHRRGYRFVAPVTVERPAAPAAAPGSTTAAAISRRRAVLWSIALAALLVIALSAARLLTRPAPGFSPVRRLLIAVPPEETLDLAFSPAIALSPAGDRLVYVARRDGTQRLFLRPLDSFEATPIQGTEGAAGPFFSPDGQWVGFFAGGKLKKVRLDGGVGGEALALCDSPYPYGASWGEDGEILFSPNYKSGLLQVSAAGGAPRILTTPNAAAGEVGHRWPELLPGGRAALFTVWRHGLADASIESLDLATGRRQVLIHGGSFPRYSPTGHLVFVRAEGLAAAPFDLRRLSVLGPPVAVLGGVRFDAQGGGQLALSASGSLAYLPGGIDTSLSAIAKIGTAGKVLTLPAPVRRYRNLSLSRDGSRLALMIRDGERSDLWTFEVDRGTLSRLTSEGDHAEPVWSPDGRWIAFASGRPGGSFGLFRVPADGSGPPQRLLAASPSRYPGSFSPDGKLLAYAEETRDSGSDLWLLSLDGPPRSVPFLRTRFDEAFPRFSPDGRWIAYQSGETGRAEIYVRPYPGPGGRWQISTDGGTLPSWSADGKRIFYRWGSTLLAVALRFDGGVSAGRPETILEDPERSRYAVAPDGREVFLFRRAAEEENERELHVVLGWSGELAGLARR